MGRLAARIFYLVLVCAVVAVAAGAWAYAEFTRPGPLIQERAVVIAKGSGPAAIGQTLANAGVIGNPDFFALVVRLLGDDRALRAGEYRFAARSSMRDAVDMLKFGRPVQRRLTIAEGLTTAEALRVLEAADGLSGAIETPPGEGVLLPETYYYSFGDGRAELVARMQESMAETLAIAWAERAEGLPLKNPREALILASIVEKETGLAEERGLVAGVFINRLRRGMRLQSDPTVVYAVTGGQGALGRRITRSDLETDSPYNTYRVGGLPPGPIANPGVESIRAVLNPEQTDALYFVADGTGGHAFARTLSEHIRNVRRWRRIRDQGTPGGR